MPARKHVIPYRFTSRLDVLSHRAARVLEDVRRTFLETASHVACELSAAHPGMHVVVECRRQSMTCYAYPLSADGKPAEPFAPDVRLEHLTRAWADVVAVLGGSCGDAPDVYVRAVDGHVARAELFLGATPIVP